VVLLSESTEHGSALDSLVERARNETGAGYECRPDGRFWRLCIWGWFPPDWCGSLSLHCYAARLSVLEGDACRVRSSVWAGSFLLAPVGSGESPQALDFMNMARHRPLAIAQPTPMQIDRLQIEPDASGSFARVRIEGPDRIGFLAYVLDQLAFCGLYPHGLSVRTLPDGHAQDRFDVQGVGGTAPLPRSLATLEALLRPRA
jgi:hypothetical protein